MDDKLQNTVNKNMRYLFLYLKFRSQRAYADKVGILNISRKYNVDSRQPLNFTIDDVQNACKKLHVNQNWILYTEGDIFEPGWGRDEVNGGVMELSPNNNSRDYQTEIKLLKEQIVALQAHIRDLQAMIPFLNADKASE